MGYGPHVHTPTWRTRGSPLSRLSPSTNSAWLKLPGNEASPDVSLEIKVVSFTTITWWHAKGEVRIDHKQLSVIQWAVRLTSLLIPHLTVRLTRGLSQRFLKALQIFRNCRTQLKCTFNVLLQREDQKEKRQDAHKFHFDAMWNLVMTPRMYFKLYFGNLKQEVSLQHKITLFK